MLIHLGLGRVAFYNFWRVNMVECQYWSEWFRLSNVELEILFSILANSLVFDIISLLVCYTAVRLSIYKTTLFSESWKKITRSKIQAV